MPKYRIFIGYEPRQPVAFNVAQFSVFRNASRPIAITPLVLNQLPIKRRGLTEFTFSRFLVPYLCDFKGLSMFMDPDMIVTGDVCELLDSIDMTKGAVHVVKNQPAFEYPSMMVFSNPRCKKLSPEFIDDESNVLYDFKWAKDIGEIDPAWNHCCSYNEPKQAKLYHFTAGIPIWDETAKMYDEVNIWNDEFRRSNSSVGYNELMGNSVHEERRVNNK